MNLIKYVYNNKINKIVLNDPTKFVSDWTKTIQLLRNIKLRELFYIYLWEPSENMRLERRLTTHIFLTEAEVRKLNF